MPNTEAMPGLHELINDVEDAAVYMTVHRDEPSRVRLEAERVRTAVQLVLARLDAESSVDVSEEAAEDATPPVVVLTVRVTPEDEAALDVQALREGHAGAAGLLQHFADLRLEHFAEREHDKAFRAQYESVPAPLSNAERAVMEAKGRG